MDTAVALVQAYLHVNGYFTVAEYPVLEALRGDQVRTVTDLDILAYRFAGAGTTSSAALAAARLKAPPDSSTRFWAAQPIGQT